MSEEEKLADNIEVITKQGINKENLDICMIYGISGNCGKRCPRFKDRTCEEYLTTLENEYKSDELEIKRLKEEYVILQNASDEVEEEKDREIERLNNIINELEKYLEEIKDRVIMYGIDDDTYKTTNLYRDIKLKIKELKGSDKE